MNNIEYKINELKDWIIKIGLTQKYFSQQYYIEVYEDLNEEEINRFYQKFKGHMKRKTTSIETINLYLNFLFEMDEFKNISYIKPKFYEEESFSDEFNKRMKKISKDITDKLIEE